MYQSEYVHFYPDTKINAAFTENRYILTVTVKKILPFV